MLGRVLIVLIICVCQSVKIWNYPDFLSNMYVKHETRNVTLKQGTLQGIVVGWKSNRKLGSVEQFRGIPYAAAPVGDLRFMPSGSAPSWFGLKIAEHFSPVCPQKFPDEKRMTQERREEFLRLKQFLLNESEDCLYLNIYAPHREDGRSYHEKYAVIVYIHGESFEWNSGYPYDGSVLAAYGNVIVVTLNYRLGVLGFLKASTEEYSESNFGLVDQIAALLWVKANIAAFGGDPDRVTLMGHGTGAVCASLLTLSQMVLQEGNKTLFQRAILMGGSALADWALAGNPRDVTYQVAQALNCQIDDDFAACLRRKRLDEIMAAPVVTPPYRSRFAPVVDHLVVPNDPKKLMTKYTDLFRRFDLIYGVTELESIHLLDPDALKLGMLEKERDQELRKYLRSRCEMRQEVCVTRTLAAYTDSETSLDEQYMGYTGHEPDRASLARDALLDILSDARSAAPVVQMAKYHAAVNPASFFYVFTHRTEWKEYIRDKSYTGEELPYVFGVPLGGSPFHFNDHYTDKERLLSEIIMTYFTSFAQTGNPNVPRKSEYLTLGLSDWIKFDVDWPQFDLNQQQYLQLGITPYILSHYREDKLRFWNEILPEISHNHSIPFLNPVPKKPLRTNPAMPRNPPPYILTHPPPRKGTLDKYENFNKPLDVVFGRVKLTGTAPPDNMMNNVVYGSVVTGVEDNNKSFLTTITIIMGAIFLLSNILLFLSIYLRRKRKMRNALPKEDEPQQIDTSTDNKLIPNGCNIMKIVSKSSPSEDTYEAVKSSDGKSKLPRQMSNSTIDAHAKVRDWITNEIVYKYSPRFLRRNNRRESKQLETNKTENDSTLGRSPTRPASPSDNFKGQERPPLIKSSSKTEKISVAIDATPTGRGNSVLEQVPIELTKSLRRSLTLEDFSSISNNNKKVLRKSSTSINLEPAVIRIEHSHSKSEPVQDLYAYTNPKKLKTFDPQQDVNVTSREEPPPTIALTPEEALMSVKRRNFPKVLPDYPTREDLARKRRSMPASHHIFQRVPVRFPPAPPVRTTSTLTRKPPQPAVCQSAPMLAQEPPEPDPEPEVTCNNLYVGPLIPKTEKNLNTQPIYERLRLNTKKEEEEVVVVKPAKTIITADPNQPIRKVDPKVIIKPTMTRSLSDGKKNIPRVVVQDNVVGGEGKEVKKVKPSMIPTLVKSTKESSSSESTPSEESDTGTVVKKL